MIPVKLLFETQFCVYFTIFANHTWNEVDAWMQFFKICNITYTPQFDRNEH